MITDNRYMALNWGVHRPRRFPLLGLLPEILRAISINNSYDNSY